MIYINNKLRAHDSIFMWARIDLFYANILLITFDLIMRYFPIFMEP